MSLSPSEATEHLGTVRVFEHDPDLLLGLGERDAGQARVRGLANTVRLDKGKWRPRPRPRDEVAGHLGLLVLDGLLARNTIVAAAPCPELVGTGDLLRPWQDGSGFSSLPWETDWDVLEPATLALLDARFATTICPWPSIFAALLERMMERHRWLSLQVAIGHLRRVDARLLVLLWHLGDRWGAVRPEGVHLPMRLTHSYLAKLIGAQRPSVTLALTELTERGRLRREPDGSWVLLRPVPEPGELLAQTGNSDRRAEVSGG